MEEEHDEPGQEGERPGKKVHEVVGSARRRMRPDARNREEREAGENRGHDAADDRRVEGFRLQETLEQGEADPEEHPGRQHGAPPEGRRHRVKRRGSEYPDNRTHRYAEQGPPGAPADDAADAQAHRRAVQHAGGRRVADTEMRPDEVAGRHHGPEKERRGKRGCECWHRAQPGCRVPRHLFRSIAQSKDLVDRPGHM